MKQTFLSLLGLIMMMTTLGCTGLPSQADPQAAEDAAAVRSTFIAERGGPATGGDVMRIDGTIGTIVAIEGDLITVEDPQGGASSVALAEDGSVIRQSAGERSDLKVGESVTVIVSQGLALAIQIGNVGDNVGMASPPLMIQTSGEPGSDATMITPVSGSVTEVEGNTITIEPAEGGDATTVTLNAQTMIEKSEIVPLATLEIGMTISALGDPDAEGVVRATEIRIMTMGDAPIRLPAP